MKPLLYLGALVLLASGCRDGSSPNADNTAQNRGDGKPEAVTPADQSNRAEDVEVVAKIRRELVNDESLSPDAQNVKVVLKEDVVVLRGPVGSERERQKVVAAASQYSAKVQDQLSVKQPDNPEPATSAPAAPAPPPSDTPPTAPPASETPSTEMP